MDWKGYAQPTGETRIQRAVEYAEMLKTQLISGGMDGTEFERLRNRLFQAVPEVRERLCASDQIVDLEFSLAGADYYLADRAQGRTQRGFKGGFYVAAEPVSLASFETFVDTTGYDYPAEILDYLGETLEECDPMVALTWDDATAYCRWLSEQSGIWVTLPYREEWELAGAAVSSWLPEVDMPVDEKWVPPGTESYGGFRVDSSHHGPGMSGVIWEWCQDWGSVHGDLRTTCSGIWPNAKGSHMGTRVMEHIVRTDRRLSTAGLRPVVFTDECLWQTNRNVISGGRDASPIGEYLKSAICFDGVPGSVGRPTERPGFYYQLTPDLKQQIDTVLGCLQELSTFREKAVLRDEDGGNEYSLKGSVGLPSVTSIRPVSERRLEIEDLISESPESTAIRLVPELMLEAPQITPPSPPRPRSTGVMGLFARLRQGLKVSAS